MLSERKRSDKNWGWSEMGRDGWRRRCHFFFASLFFPPFLSQPWTDRWCRGWSVWNARAAADVTSGRCGYHKRRQWWIRTQGNAFGSVSTFLATWCENRWWSEGKKERKKPKNVLVGCQGNDCHQMCLFENVSLKFLQQIDLRPNSNCRILFMYYLFWHFDISVTFPQAAKLAVMVKLKLCLI